MAQHKANSASRLLTEIPGIGPIGALTLAMRIDPPPLESGRSLAASAGPATGRCGNC